MTKTGIYEWADAGFGIENGCEHGCLYCYAAEKKIRLGLVKDRKAWLTPTPCKSFRIPKGERLMFPTSHDITPRNYRRCEDAVSRMVQAGRKGLVVSKPHFECISRLLMEHPAWQDLGVEFRFTIGSTQPHILRFWEPGAPDPTERLYCIHYAVRAGFRVSVSAEPCLDWHAAKTLVGSCLNAGASEVWVGMMNDMGRRLAHLRPMQRSTACYQHVADWQNYPERIIAKCDELRQTFGERVVWKDSIKKLMGADQTEEGAHNETR